MPRADAVCTLGARSADSESVTVHLEQLCMGSKVGNRIAPSFGAFPDYQIVRGVGGSRAVRVTVANSGAQPVHVNALGSASLDPPRSDRGAPILEKFPR